MPAHADAFPYENEAYSGKLPQPIQMVPIHECYFEVSLGKYTAGYTGLAFRKGRLMMRIGMIFRCPPTGKSMAMAFPFM